MLIMAIVGILAGYIWTMSTKTKETKETKNTKEGFTLFFGFKGSDIINTEELAHPQPYKPARPTNDAPYSDKPTTAYMDFKPDSEKNMLEDDPRDLAWMASWSKADQFARRGHNCVPTFTIEGPDGTTIETTSKSCESGMPHTRAGDRIVIPDSIPEPLKAEIIGHEMVHIYQRRFPDAWRDFYRQKWSFEFHTAPPPNMPRSVIEARRSNPDTWMHPWTAWMGRYWPVPVYTDPKQPSLREAITVWWDTWTNKILNEPPQAWTAFFGRPTQDEHPNEIAAVMIVTDDYSTEAGRRLLSWWQTTGALLKAKARKAM